MSTKDKIANFDFFAITSELRELATYFWHHRDPLAKARCNMCMMTFNGSVNI